MPLLIYQRIERITKDGYVVRSWRAARFQQRVDTFCQRAALTLCEIEIIKPEDENIAVMRALYLAEDCRFANALRARHAQKGDAVSPANLLRYPSIYRAEKRRHTSQALSPKRSAWRLHFASVTIGDTVVNIFADQPGTIKVNIAAILADNKAWRHRQR